MACATGCDNTTIGAAITAATSTDTIIVMDVTYAENIDYGTKVLNIKGQTGATNTSIVGDGSDAAVVTFANSALTASTILDGFTINNANDAGAASRGISITSSAAPTLKNLVLKGNRVALTSYGGAVYISGATATIQDSIIGATTDKNQADRGAGIYALLDTADGAGGNAEVLYTISGSNVSANSGAELFIPSSHTYVPRGNVTTQDAGGHVDINSTFTATAASTITVSGDWDNAGTFTANTSTVIYSGTNQSIIGSTTFNNFSKTDSSNDATVLTLTFDNLATQTINGTFTLNGLDDSNRINLVSDRATKFAHKSLIIMNIHSTLQSACRNTKHKLMRNNETQLIK